MATELSSITPEQLQAEWLSHCIELQYVHYTAGNIYARLNFLLGGPVVVLSAAAGTSTFVYLESGTNQVALIVTGIVSMSVAVLAGLQTFLRFSERAEQHRTVGARYGAIKRKIEQMSARKDVTEVDTDQFIDSIRKELDALAQDAPGVSGSMFRRAISHMRVTESR